MNIQLTEKISENIKLSRFTKLIPTREISRTDVDKAAGIHAYADALSKFKNEEFVQSRY
ncbi:MAG: hypothetical protein K2X29_09570 [Candidatus Obscuribacterales bacterium]|nr:hypothetical protein [Candidatus Obscuribacterales bacterium]